MTFIQLNTRFLSLSYGVLQLCAAFSPLYASLSASHDFNILFIVCLRNIIFFSSAIFLLFVQYAFYLTSAPLNATARRLHPTFNSYIMENIRKWPPSARLSGPLYSSRLAIYVAHFFSIIVSLCSRPAMAQHLVVITHSAR